MSDEVTENIELIEPIDTPVLETETTTEETPVESKPYKERKIPENIPYKRFQEVTHKAKELETKTSELERRLQEREQEIQKYREKQESVRKYGSIDDIKSNLDKMSPEEMVESLAAVMETKVSSQFEERRRAQEIQAYETKIIQDFGSKITAAESTIPDIREMVDYVNHHAQQIAPVIRTKLLTDEFSAELIAEIASSPEILNQLIDGPVHESLSMLGELKAKIKYQNKPAAQPEARSVRTPSIPNGSVANGNKRIPPGVGMAEYKRLRSLGYT